MKRCFFILMCFILAINLSAQLPKVLEDDIVKSYDWLISTVSSKSCNQNNPLKPEDIMETDVNKCEFVHSFKIKPNPSNGHFYLTFEANKKATSIIVSGLDGQLLFKKEMEEFEGSFDDLLDFSHFDKGLYILSIVQQKEVFTRKVLIQ